MATVHDVAAYVLERQGEMTAMKLQKLCFYSQAWSLVWDDAPLFSEPFEAWANGPVAPALYREHSGLFTVRPSDLTRGDPTTMTRPQIATVNAVLKYYGKKTAARLSDLTHNERPWLDARGDLPAGARSNVEITPSAMVEYYGALYASRDDD